MLTCIPYWYNVEDMHVITKSALVEFWKKHASTRNSLEAWHRVIKNRNFKNFSELRLTFGSVDFVGGLTIFNVGGNNVRVIASIHYNRKKVYIRQVLTHVEYDSGDWKKK